MWLWWVDYIDPKTGQRRREKVGPSKDEAMARLLERKQPPAQPAAPPPTVAAPVTFADAVPRYMTWAKTHKRSWDRDEVCLRRLGEVFGRTPLDQVRAVAIEQYKQDRLSSISPHTHRPVSNRQLNYELAILKAFFNKAKRWDLMTNNPMDKVDLLRLNNRRLRFLDPKEARAFLAACTGPLAHMAAPFIMAIHSGARIGEILGLLWSDIDFSNGLVHIREAKNGRERFIHMDDDVRTALRSMISVGGILKPPAGEAYVFLSHRTGYRYQSLRNGFMSAAKKAGLKGVTWHTCRHTAASWMVMGGTPLAVVAEILGHRGISMTLRYAHLSPDSRKAGVEELQRVFGNGEKAGRDGKV